MNMLFNTYLKSLDPDNAAALRRIITIIATYEPNAVEGLSYGLPAFRLKDRPLIGFSSNKHGLNIYPFDPQIITAIKPQLDGFEVSKGVIRFSPEHEIPEVLIIAMLDLRLKVISPE